MSGCTQFLQLEGTLEKLEGPLPGLWRGVFALPLTPGVVAALGIHRGAREFMDMQYTETEPTLAEYIEIIALDICTDCTLEGALASLPDRPRMLRVS